MMVVTITTEEFGKTKDGENVHRFIFEGSKVRVSVLDFGCAIQSVEVPDRAGTLVDIALGYDDVAGYEKNTPYIGVVVGRVAGRIAGGKFSMDGQDYSLVVNNRPNNIHGGLVGFSRRLWTPFVNDNRLTLTYRSPEGEDGFPGDMDVTLTYTLDEDGLLTLDYLATTTKPCPLNFTNHSYFNLAGQDCDDVLDHVVQISAEKFVPVDHNLIPTGELPDVDGRSQDLRFPVELRSIKDAVCNGDLDLTFCVGEDGMMKRVSKVVHPATGRYIETSTTEPGLQFYTAMFMSNTVGKSGKSYKPFASFCLETQHFPDSVNHPNFPNTILRPGETYKQSTVYTFGVEKE
ncbi:hypothetical protein DPMN_094063 [Dreissena polymorpha]|uniref:Aldose 1-epimerase n=2 Tax=Dreissena polymorpha TaxID=45954 RepID=A0A9D4R1H6_DREPO|nr:hypothetical protein DPMN_094063 [Dreissena polymorpha]